MLLLIYLSSGIFLGWSLGANDAANVFGTAVGTKMVKFRIAAIVASLFVILGAVTMGAGASHTLGELGSINALGGSFTVALAAGFTVTAMIKLNLPVSTSQAIVGAIVGWNYFAGAQTDYNSLLKIASTWVLCPLLSAFFSLAIYKIFKIFIERSSVHILTLDSHTRIALILVGAFGSFSLGANNISNVMGVFVDASPFKSIMILDTFEISGTQQLFLIGALAIALGIFTYSKRVMKTVGSALFKLSPITAFIVVLAQSLVLLIMSSEGLQTWLVRHQLPSIPLVPVSSSQAVIGAILGIALAKGVRNVQYKVLGRISIGWITTPIIAGLVSFMALFIVKNVFDQKVYEPVQYRLEDKTFSRLKSEGISEQELMSLNKGFFDSALALRSYLKRNSNLTFSEINNLIRIVKYEPVFIDRNLFAKVDRYYISASQMNSLYLVSGKRFDYRWEFRDALAKYSDAWEYKPDSPINKRYNKELKKKLDYLFRLFTREDIEETYESIENN
ncbi:MAG: inorganic phosphate transporter [Candidatus Cloacimonetes bacterium]|nr:inorganic phosphate transporter [Candidatus Cloacimonadota bacterium]